MKDNDDGLKEFFNNTPYEREFQFDKDNSDKFFAALKKERENKKRLFIYLSFLGLLLGLSSVYFLNNERDAEKKLAINYNKLNSAQSLNTKIEHVTAKHQTLFNHKISATNTIPQKTEKINAAELSDVVPNKIPLKAFKPNTAPVLFKEKEYLPQTKNESTNKVQSLSSNENVEPIENTFTKAKEEVFLNQKNQEPNAFIKNVSENEAVNKNSDLENNQTKNPEVISTKDSVVNNHLLSVPTKHDSVATLAATPRDTAVVKAALKRVLSVDLGADYLSGWKNTSKTEANGFNPIAGINYYNAYSPKIGLLIGIYYTQINNLNATNYVSTNTRLKFGEESDVTIISAGKMHYLMVPVKFVYSLNAKNILGIGYNWAYLLDVESSIETYTKRLNYQSASVFTKSMGYKTGFNSFDGQLALSYQRHLYKELFIVSEFFYGLRDIKNNNIYNSSVFERTKGFKLTLRINLLKK